MKAPNFFFVGHPRSGTGTLDGYLSAHPDIFMAAKELHFFGSDLGFNVPTRSMDNYLSYFEHADAYQRVGESSTWYLASHQAAAEIHAFAPDAKIIISLRNPVDWLYSLHSHQVYAAYEDIADFSAALHAEKNRLKGKDLPLNAFPPMGVLYRQLVQYHTQVERYFHYFGRENVLVHLFDDLKSQPAKVLDETLDFLQLNRHFDNRAQVLQGNKKRRNANHKHRSASLHQWLKSPPRRSILHGVVPPPFPGAKLAIRALHRLNTTTQPRQAMELELRKKLIQDFSVQIDQCEELLQRDLQAWKSF